MTTAMIVRKQEAQDSKVNNLVRFHSFVFSKGNLEKKYIGPYMTPGEHNPTLLLPKVQVTPP